MPVACQRCELTHLSSVYVIIHHFPPEIPSHSLFVALGFPGIFSMTFSMPFSVSLTRLSSCFYSQDRRSSTFVLNLSFRSLHIASQISLTGLKCLQTLACLSAEGCQIRISSPDYRISNHLLGNSSQKPSKWNFTFFSCIVFPISVNGIPFFLITDA